MSLLPGSFVPILYFLANTSYFWQYPIPQYPPVPHGTPPRWCIWFRKVRAGNLISTTASGRRMSAMCHPIHTYALTHSYPLSARMAITVTPPASPPPIRFSWPLSCRWCTLSYVLCLETEMVANSFDSVIRAHHILSFNYQRCFIAFCHGQWAGQGYRFERNFGFNFKTRRKELKAVDASRSFHTSSA